MKTHKIAVLAGDGTGPEVVAEALKVANAAAKLAGFALAPTYLDWGGERYLRTGETLPKDGIATLKKFDAIYLGAIGHPNVAPGILERGLLLELRFQLDQYINLRPVKLYPGVETPLAGKRPEDIDFIVVRENTEDLYTGIGGVFKKGTPDEVATQTSMNTRKGVERCLRYAFDLCRKRNDKKQLTLVAKTNVLTFAHDLWMRAFEEIGAEYPDITRDYNPEHYDTIVTTNMFGDIITDLAAMIQGGMGVAAGGNIRPGGLSMFEPMGGSAPKYTGQGVINPIAAIAAAGMMLDQLGEGPSAARIEQAIMKATPKMASMSAGKMGRSTSQVGDLVCELL
jgi:3-isopropylmalate dehydrogenase